ncbi:MAG TPA: helix-turn-helix transcriptional regulator [Thermoanaerobaculia bacterium]|nr:helix-turn-helix transcriptional regulator [Thermoanaerobaculia bacterium]
MTIGERLRSARQAQEVSLTEIAAKAGISAATLSRIETDKQGLDLGLFLTLAQVLKADPNQLLGEHDVDEESDPLARRIEALGSADRTQLWRDLTTARRERRRTARPDLTDQFEELAAQFEYIRQQIESVRSNLRRK